jgi:hypothetical protein
VDTFGIGSIPIIGPIINNLVQGQWVYYFGGFFD